MKEGSFLLILIAINALYAFYIRATENIGQFDTVIVSCLIIQALILHSIYDEQKRNNSNDDK